MDILKLLILMLFLPCLALTTFVFTLLITLR